jgi:hypothetical protein
MPKAFRRARNTPVTKALALLSPEDRTRFETLKIAADNTRSIAHAMLDAQLDTIMPELLAAIDLGKTFAVLVVDPEQMPVMPERHLVLAPNGKPVA